MLKDLTTFSYLADEERRETATMHRLRLLVRVSVSADEHHISSFPIRLGFRLLARVSISYSVSMFSQAERIHVSDGNT